MSKRRVAVIGCGMIANSAHFPALNILREQGEVEVVGVADIREQAARETAERHNVPKWYLDPQQMLDELKPDFVAVCTPNMYHKKWTIAALRALGLGAIVSTEPPALSRVWLCESDYFCYCSSQLNTVFSDWFDQNTLHSFIDADDRNGYRADFPLALSADECDLQSLFSLGRLRTKKHDDYMIWMIFEAEDGTLSLPMCVSEKSLQAAGYGDLPGRIEQLQV